MIARTVLSVLIAALMVTLPAHAQVTVPAPAPEQYVNPVEGLSLEGAIARALEQEPSLQAARSEIEVARGMRQQASLRPNPTVSFERREEPAGSGNQTTVAMEWPLDLFRRGERVAVADREITAVQLAVADRERLLVAEVRARYGDVLESARDLEVIDELLASTLRQRDLLGSRVEQGATPPLERDLLTVEVRRLEADRLILAGRTAAALFELKRILGMPADATLALREPLEEVVRRESSLPQQDPEVPAVLDARADVREAAARTDAAAARVDRARAEGRFDVSLFANYMRMNAGFPQRGFGPLGGVEPIGAVFHNVSAGAMIMVPILNRNQGEVAAARAEQAGARSAYEAARLAAGAELAAARVRDQHARQAVGAYVAAQTLARQNLAVVAQSYELGRITVFDVLAEQRRYLDVARGYTAALTTAYQARTALGRALGGVR